MKKKQSLILLVVGLICGVGAIVLMLQGNPKNMGLCIACFIRDTAGGLHLHGAGVVKYVRPEIIGLILGSFIISLATREFKTRGGSSPMTRLAIGFLVMVGALVFLGCPMRMVLRMAAGDLNAWIGFVGFVAGVFAGTLFLRKGFSLRRTYDLPVLGGYIMPAVQVVFFALLVGAPGLLAFSEEGPGAAKAPIWFALVITLLLGMMVQKTRLCMAGGVRDVLMFNDWTLMLGTIGIFVSALIVNLVTGKFQFWYGGPTGHYREFMEYDRPLCCRSGFNHGRRLSDAPTNLNRNRKCRFGTQCDWHGYWGRICHNFKLASSGEGTTPNGRIVVLVAAVLLLLLGFANKRRKADV